MWATQDKFYNSMKWHLADPDTVEVYGEEVGWGEHKYVEERISVVIICAGQVGDSRWNATYARLDSARIQDKLKLSQANICAYCKKQRMKELGILDMYI